MDKSNNLDLAAELKKRGLHPEHWSELQLELGKKNDFRCAYCGRDLLASIEAYHTWEVDHIIPSKLGGPDTPRNKTVTCTLCNAAKHNFDPRTKAGPTASNDELIAVAKEYVQKCREKKISDLKASKTFLRDIGLISDDRLANTKE